MTALEARSGQAHLKGEVTGRGRTVVFLHAGVADRRMWRAQASALAERCQVVTYDRRGFGETRPVDEDYSHVRDLLAVLDAAGADRATLVGCSQGGKIALDFTLAHSDRVEGLVLVAPSIGGVPATETFPAPVEALLEELEAAEASGDLDRLNRMEARVWLDGVLGEEGRVSGEVRELFLDMNGIALRGAEVGQEEPAPPAWPRLGKITVPAWAICGDLDFPHLQERCASLGEVLPGTRSLVLEGTAHLPSLEQPGAFNTLLLPLLPTL
ncbi:alpha/beta hydrolase [Deinococcus sp. YIM 134068]|uniref:alpha/beta fold hydrolase n=1 Tax=Deinococcus lichenicola TaxID=3118910 RepID=UPI002F928A51